MPDQPTRVEPSPVRQERNRTWWTRNRMSYDWNEPSPYARESPAWFDDIDRRFLFGARLFDGSPNPFAGLIGLDRIAGKRVLEIGCGMGLHTEMMLRAGARLSAIDLSPASVAATRARLALKGLDGDVREMDGERLGFADGTFDLVWAWGVVHHSERTGRILQEIERVLKPGGEARLMVYHLGGMSAYLSIVRRYLLGFWSGRSLDEILWRDSDGFTARYYTRDQWWDLLATFFEEVELRVFGQDADAVPLPRKLRRVILSAMPRARQQRLAGARGSLLFSIARKPAP